MVSHDTLQCSIKLANAIQRKVKIPLTEKSLERCSLLFYVKMTSNSNNTAASATYTAIFLAVDIIYYHYILSLLLGLRLWLLREGKLSTVAFQGGSS